MPLRSRIVNVFRGDRVARDIAEELQCHIDEAVEQGRDPAEARRAFGSVLRETEKRRDIRVLAWLDSLRADAVFGWRQLMKRKVTSAAALLSLALAIGSCLAAFRLIDAVLLRPLPVAHPERLYVISRHGTDFNSNPATFDGFAYLAVPPMRAAVKDQATLLAVSYSERVDLTYQSDAEMEKAHLQYVSGMLFGAFGLHPSIGRLLTPNDDLERGAHPYAILSHDYWARRFHSDPRVIGHTFRLGSAQTFAGSDAVAHIYTIVGVIDGPFTGTEPGIVVDVFLPTMMHPGVTRDDWTWTRLLALINPGVALEPVRAKLDAASHAFEENRAKGFTGMSKAVIGKLLAAQTVVLEPAGSGASSLKTDYRRSLLVLGILVALVLAIACANVANLLTAQASARAREMALRVSIGAGRWRLVQLVMMETAWLALLASAGGALFAWWSAPLVIRRIHPAGDPVRLALPADWRVAGFIAALTLGVTFLLGLTPALRSSAVRPAEALRGGSDPHARRRVMRVLVALQAAFCFLLLFSAGLFVSTLDRLSHRPIGFSPERLLAVDIVAQRAQPPAIWDQLASGLRTLPGVKAVALGRWALLAQQSWNDFVSIDGAPPSSVLAYFESISPGWLDAAKIPLIAGRDFRPGDVSPGVAIVDAAFAKQFFGGRSPVGKAFVRGSNRFEVVGLVPNVPYHSLREPDVPEAYFPFASVDANGRPNAVRAGTFLVRTSMADPLALAATLSRVVPGIRPEFRVSEIRPETGMVDAQTVRERLLAALALFFAVVALLLAGVGLYGVLDYSVVQRRREIGIRMAIGARASNVGWRVTSDVLAMLIIGAVAGLTFGMASARYIQSLLYDVNPSDPGMLALPALALLAVGVAAALPAVIRAIQTDPVSILRSE